MALLAASAALLAGCGKGSVPLGAPVVRSASATSAKAVVKAPAATVSSASAVAYLTAVGASSPAFSPRGDRLAFSTPSHGVELAGPGGENPQPLAGSVAGDREPAFSPAGDAVAVVRASASGGTMIVRIDLAGGRVTPLYQAAGAVHQPAWLPGGRGLVFVQDGATSAVLRLDLATNATSPLWQGAAANAPTVSADGSQVVFDAGTLGLRRVATSGGPLTTLAVAGVHPRHPAFSPTGHSLAYVADDGLYIASADGSQARRVASGKGFDCPTWHPTQPQLVAAATTGSRTDLTRVALPAK